MGDSYTAVVDEHATLADSELLADRALKALIARRIVRPDLDPESVLGGKGGYRPGEQIPTLYSRRQRECEFRKLSTNGLEIKTGPWFNFFGTVAGLEELSCPICGNRVESSVPEEYFKAVSDYLDGKPCRDVTCPRCALPTKASSWKAKPHLGFSNLAFIFWNWPSLDYEGWKINIPGLIEEAIGHPTVLTYGDV